MEFGSGLVVGEGKVVAKKRRGDGNTQQDCWWVGVWLDRCEVVSWM